MRCAVVFGVTLRLLVINISSSSPTINTAAYYQRCVTLTLARRWPWSTGDGVYTVFAPVDEIVIRRSRSEITGRYPTCLLFPSWSRELQLSMQLVVYLEVNEHVKIAVSLQETSLNRDCCAAGLVRYTECDGQPAGDRPCLSAAFDCVDLDILLSRLQSCFGLGGISLIWIWSFLTDRSHRVLFGRSFSIEIMLLFGVPQGSALGPLLFLL